MNVTVTARRTIACLTACNGISTELLEAGAVERLIAASRHASETLDAVQGGVHGNSIQARAAKLRLDVALARIDGGAL